MFGGFLPPSPCYQHFYYILSAQFTYYIEKFHKDVKNPYLAIYIVQTIYNIGKWLMLVWPEMKIN